MLISRLFSIAGILFFTFIHTLALADISTGTWTTAAPAPTQRTEMAAAAIDGKVYVVGGFNKPNLNNALKFAISDEVTVYDTAADSWSLTTSLPEGRHHAGIASLNGMLYVVGGFTKSFLSVWHAGCHGLSIQSRDSRMARAGTDANRARSTRRCSVSEPFVRNRRV